jgi:hypothetical protein
MNSCIYSVLLLLSFGSGRKIIELPANARPSAAKALLGQGNNIKKLLIKNNNLIP